MTFIPLTFYDFHPPYLHLMSLSSLKVQDSSFLVPAMPELLRSAKLAIEKGLAQGRNETYVKQLSDYIVPALVEALHKVILIYHFNLWW